MRIPLLYASSEDLSSSRKAPTAPKYPWNVHTHILVCI